MKIENLLKKINKYYIFVNNVKKNKVSLVGTNSNKKEIFDNLKIKLEKKVNQKNYSDFSIILVKITKVKYNSEQPIKMVFGPIKVEINFFELSKRCAIKTNKYESRNNHLFYTLKYLEKNKIKTKDFKKIVQLAISNKLEKRLLAPKTIEQILK
tara:strand:+ start:902 stop:1363 length:462 start_codon:yes stop_codon:yes gene_type:complete